MITFYRPVESVIVLFGKTVGRKKGRLVEGVPELATLASINPCFNAGKISGVGNCHAAWRHQKTTVCTTIVQAQTAYIHTTRMDKMGKERAQTEEQT
jgi:hypothetical protein